MKNAIKSIYLAAGFSALLLAGCNADDYNKESTTTETTVTDSTTVTMPDTTRQMMTDTSQKMRTDTAGNKSGAMKTKKGKVSTTMMTNSGKSSPMSQDKQGYYSSVEVLPMFPGGQNSLNDFVNSNIEYPETANDNGIEGVVTVNFAVDEAGKVSNSKIVGKPLGYGLEDEVIAAVNKMPTWTPGVIKGKNVKTYYTLPVNFRLDQ